MSAWQGGYIEARLRYTDSPWSWPAFWLFSAAKTEAWPGEDCTRLNAEWDIMENGVQNADGAHPADSSYVTALHRNTTDNSSDGYCGTPDTQRTYGEEHPVVDLSAWHVWGGLWVDNLLCTYVDGRLVQCMQGFDSTAQPMHAVFTMQYLHACANCGPRPPQLAMEVDWVRVWKPA